jgi:hypothetical protein
MTETAVGDITVEAEVVICVTDFTAGARASSVAIGDLNFMHAMANVAPARPHTNIRPTRKTFQRSSRFWSRTQYRLLEAFNVG